MHLSSGVARTPRVPTHPIPSERRRRIQESRLVEPARDRVTHREKDSTPIQQETRGTSRPTQLGLSACTRTSPKPSSPRTSRAGREEGN